MLNASPPVTRGAEETLRARKLRATGWLLEYIETADGDERDGGAGVTGSS